MLELLTNDKLCVDIRGKTMKYAQGHYNGNKKRIEIKKYGSIQFSQEHTDNGLLCECEDTVRVISNFIRKERISAKTVYLNISDPSIVLRIVKVPFMSGRDLKDYLNLEISQYLPVDFNTNVFDYKVLETVEEDGKNMLNLLLTSVPRDIILNCTKLFKKAGLDLQAIDVYPNSISRVFCEQKNMDIAIVDINENAIDFVILKKGKLFMYSNILIENGFSLSVREEENIDLLVEEDGMFAAALNEVVNYTRTYMNFFSSKHFGKGVDIVYLLGEVALIKGIGTYFSNMLQIEVGLGLPSQVFGIHPKKESFGSIRNLNIDKKIAMYSCNLGLIMRGV